ncbi:MAG: glycosyltransferase [Prevotellaceae bacterium]|jgi:glycosyltransferase involved in cell wall biosynthesis|nr:glycosyltransferase [Prevotellaceae bacterium]
MNIGLFNESFPPVMDGVAVAVENTAIGLSKLGHDTSVVTPYCPNRNIEHLFNMVEYPSIPVPFRSPYRVGLPILGRSFARDLHRTSFDILHAHSPFSAGQLARKKARKAGIPFIATFHSKFKDDFSRVIKNKAIVNAMVKQIISFYDCAEEVWIPQPAVVETLREYGYKGKVEVVPNGVDFSGLTDYAQKVKYKQQLDIAPNTKVLLFVGQHIYEKNLKFILDSLYCLKRVSYKMFFVGEGYARKDLVKLTESYGLSSNVDFIGTITDRSRLNTYFRAADLFLFPSKYDNAPLVVREAAAALAPSLLLEHSTAAEVIVNDHNGFLATEDVNVYADAIARILNADISSIAYNASQTLCTSWHDVALETADRYKQLILRKSHKPILAT